MHNLKKASVLEIDDTTVDNETYQEGEHCDLNEEVDIVEPKILCNTCVLSFLRKEDLEQHKSKHTYQALLPSILKKK